MHGKGVHGGLPDTAAKDNEINAVNASSEDITEEEFESLALRARGVCSVQLL